MKAFTLTHSYGLQLLIQHGGGEIKRRHRGGVGHYWRLEGNRLLDAPLPVEWTISNDGDRVLHPAALVEQLYPHAGYSVVPLDSLEAAIEYDPDLVRLLLDLQRTSPFLPTLPPRGNQAMEMAA
ncbi:MAG: hypothetical protein H6642_00090 [Caldilineaceae bacterium]|nr:hypothetical protein [Caldilineaceae bacterium]